MSTATLCPRIDLTCDQCRDIYTDRHPEVADIVESMYCLCGCVMVAENEDGTENCIGCGSDSMRSTHWQVLRARRKAAS